MHNFYAVGFAPTQEPDDLYVHYCYLLQIQIALRSRMRELLLQFIQMF